MRARARRRMRPSRPRSPRWPRSSAACTRAPRGANLRASTRRAPGPRLRSAVPPSRCCGSRSGCTRSAPGCSTRACPHGPGGSSDLQLLEGARPRAIAHAPLEIDCGGIAKGYAVDAAVAALRGGGCSAGLVNAGGDLRVFGALTERLWLREAGGTLRPLAAARGRRGGERSRCTAPAGRTSRLLRARGQSGRAALRCRARTRCDDRGRAHQVRAAGSTCTGARTVGGLEGRAARVAPRFPRPGSRGRAPHGC